MSFFVYCNSLCFKVSFASYEYYYSSFLTISMCMKYLLLSPHFQPVNGCKAVISFRKHIYGPYFFTHPGSLCLLVVSFNQFTFKVIFDTYDLMTILLIVLCLLFVGIFLLLFPALRSSFSICC